jgi:hypothetical protein
MKTIVACALAFVAPRYTVQPITYTTLSLPTEGEGHACLLQPATSADACDGSRDCLTGTGGAENCQLPGGWNGPTNDKCVCPVAPI